MATSTALLTQGGSAGYGTIYQITPQGSFSVLHNFDVASGNYAEVTLLQLTNGVLYGDTQSGGNGNSCPSVAAFSTVST